MERIFKVGISEFCGSFVKLIKKACGQRQNRPADPLFSRQRQTICPLFILTYSL